MQNDFDGCRPAESQEIGFDSIAYCSDTRLRKLRPELVDELAESMRKEGQITPITVCQSRNGTTP
jgi:ParB-like chromosome segregation protein Spo0J